MPTPLSIVSWQWTGKWLLTDRGFRREYEITYSDGSVERKAL